MRCTYQLFETVINQSCFFSELAENVIRTCTRRNLLQPPCHDDKAVSEDEDLTPKNCSEEENHTSGGSGGDRPDFLAWKVAIRNLNK